MLPQPHRIPPSVDPQVEVLPPCGGRWIRDLDGGLTPSDEDTARAAGLSWPQPQPETPTED